MRPDVELQTYKGVEVVYPKMDVTDDEVEGAIQHKLQGQARLVEITDRDVAEGDLVVELVAAGTTRSSMSQVPW